MKNLIIAVVLLCLSLPCFAQALHGHASNVLILPPNAFFCAPLSENGPGAPIPSCNSGSGTVLSSSVSFTSLTIIIQTNLWCLLSNLCWTVYMFCFLSINHTSCW